MKLRTGILPLALFILIFILLLLGLKKDPRDLPSALINHPMPAFMLQDLAGNKVTEQIFTNKISIINVWASWCYSCLKEHPELFKLANNSRLALIGIDYKDDNNNAIKWLHELGNPYAAIIADPLGELALDLGVYGVPETFIVDQKGIIRLRISGPISAKIISEKINPLIAAL